MRNISRMGIGQTQHQLNKYYLSANKKSLAKEAFFMHEIKSKYLLTGFKLGNLAG